MQTVNFAVHATWLYCGQGSYPSRLLDLPQYCVTFCHHIYSRNFHILDAVPECTEMLCDWFIARSHVNNVAFVAIYTLVERLACFPYIRCRSHLASSCLFQQINDITCFTCSGRCDRMQLVVPIIIIPLWLCDVTSSFYTF